MKHSIAVAALALAATLALSLSAQAQNGTLTRSFVSSSGLDSNPCTIAEPCATFAQAYTKVEANGIIAALDPGKYGPIAITGPVTINGNGWAAITEPAGGNGISIAATSGNVTLKGLEIDGAGAGSSGIALSSALSGDLNLNILSCAISSSTGTGISIAPSASSGTPVLDLLITNTSSLSNATGISIVPSGNASVAGTITGLNVANNSNNGFNIGGSIALAIVNSLASQNSHDGINATGAGTTVTLKGSTVVNNNVGVNMASGATVVSYGNNAITGNTTNVVGGSIPELGAVGPAGPQGPAGPIGATGAAGATGAMGATGATGPAGATGATGPQGTVLSFAQYYDPQDQTVPYQGAVSFTQTTQQTGSDFSLSSPTTVFFRTAGVYLVTFQSTTLTSPSFALLGFAINGVATSATAFELIPFSTMIAANAGDVLKVENGEIVNGSGSAVGFASVSLTILRLQ